MNIPLTKKQIKAYKLLMDDSNEVTEILYGGGARGGKTWLGCLWQIFRRLKYAGSAGMIVRRTYVDLHGTTLLTFRKVAKWLGVESYISYKFGTENCIVFSNGSRIFLRYAQYQPKDPDFARFGSYDLTDLFTDEAQEIDRQFFNIIRGRFSLLTGKGTDGKPWRCSPKMLITCNPPTSGHIIQDWWKPFKNGTLPPYRAFIRALVDDNPYVPQEYIDQLMHSDKATIQRLRYGNFDFNNEDDCLFDDYDALCDMFTNDTKYLPYSNTLPAGAADVALKGHDRFALVTYANRVYTYRQILDYTEADQLETIITDAIGKYNIPRSRFWVDADGVGNYLPDYIKGIKGFHGGSQAVDSTNYTNLKAQCYYELARRIKERQIRVTGLNAREREMLVEELQAIKIVGKDSDTSKAAINSKEEQKKLLGRSPDLADALMMCVCADLSVNAKPAKARVGRLT